MTYVAGLKSFTGYSDQKFLTGQLMAACYILGLYFP